MRKYLAIAGLCLAAACQATTSADVSRTSGAGTADAPIQVVGSQTGGAALNAYRRQNGLRALRPHAALNAAALDQAGHMARTGAQTHVGSGGSNVAQRVRRHGCSFVWAAENIAWGHQTDASAMEWWMNSPGHRANSLSPRATHYGWATVGTQRALVLAAGC